jgi:hypothetical protein
MDHDATITPRVACHSLPLEVTSPSSALRRFLDTRSDLREGISSVLVGSGEFTTSCAPDVSSGSPQPGFPTRAIQL